MQKCPVCGFENRGGIVFCENCGTSMIGVQQRLHGTTRYLDSEKLPPELEETHDIEVEDVKSDITLGTTELSASRLIRLEFRHEKKTVEIKVDKPIRLGRRDPATNASPEVDLTTQAGYRMGVSRLHAELRPKDDKKLELWDLGSSNGTQLNGERLVSNQPYVLRHGDKLQLGQLVLQIYFIS